MQEQPTDEYSLTQSEAARMLGISKNTLYALPVAYRQYRPRGRRYYRMTEIEGLKQSSIHQPKQTGEHHAGI